MTLPDNYDRCHGAFSRLMGGYDARWSSEFPCIECLRRTARMEDNKLYSFMTPPEFTTTCPERIAP
jgi:hypothetical protein